MAKITLVLLLVAVATGVVTSAELPPETKQVQTADGIVEGKREIIGDSRFFYSFRGIPYAAPPVGDLRFKNPHPVAPYATRKGFEPPMCSQISMQSYISGSLDVSGEEDCLYLHIYTPVTDATDLPVMLYIHGGGFLLGDADNFGGTPRPLLKKDVILVSIQYRLGTLGFLSTGDAELPGNLGLRDQTFAIDWIHTNIPKFGGDPNRITLFGESAGSASCHYHTLTPSSKGLFQRVILQSGSALNPWAFRDDHAKIAHMGAKDFNCPTAGEEYPDSAQLVQCFREQSVEDLVKLAMIDTVMNLPFRMVPRVDGDYLPDYPAALLKQGRFNRVDVMAGICQNEMTTQIKMMLSNDTVKSGFIENFEQTAPFLFGVDFENNKDYMAKRIMYHFVGDIKFDYENAQQVEYMLSEGMMNRGHDETTRILGHAYPYSRSNPVYRYELQHPSGGHSLAAMFNYTSELTDEWVAHGDDLMYIFDVVFGMSITNRTSSEFLSDIMVDLWTNFAKTGNPTPDLSLGFRWEPMKNENDFRYLSLVPAPYMRQDNRAEHREFWRNLPLKINKILFPERFA